MLEARRNTIFAHETPVITTPFEIIPISACLITHLILKLKFEMIFKEKM